MSIDLMLQKEQFDEFLERYLDFKKEHPGKNLGIFICKNNGDSIEGLSLATFPSNDGETPSID